MKQQKDISSKQASIFMLRNEKGSTKMENIKQCEQEHFIKSTSPNVSSIIASICNIYLSVYRIRISSGGFEHIINVKHVYKIDNGNDSLRLLKFWIRKKEMKAKYLSNIQIVTQNSTVLKSVSDVLDDGND